MRVNSFIFPVLVVLVACSLCLTKETQAEKTKPQTSADGNWIQLFNGKDLTGWTPKIRGHEYGDNYADTFRVRDGLLVISYDDYKPQDSLSLDDPQKQAFNKFGHLFYKDTFSHYVLKVEHRFVGKQIKNGPGWAIRNNGMMLHGQDPATMQLMQEFPVSVEVQLLGGNGKDDRTTLNLCTPGTNVVMDGKLFTPHCTKSNSDTFHGEQWITAEIEVRGNEVFRHRIGGRTVLEYTKPQMDPDDTDAQRLIKDGKLMLSSGTISLQSESHPTEFRKIELMVLDPDAPAYIEPMKASDSDSDKKANEDCCQ